ncbi:MAG: hypothetical protein GWM90_02795 [Gemmatimonadetes bacterium]|nr:hypothetical protein [Gemmatimonadota bacterium]NIQ52547.1 hypothetical protein [Gemmatimonadota bacterium]NIU72685.1 hypothetical protein [Gammaproteobacteria bacterium]NIX43091.1 hypothetical protein [Gemmatimonadota bacterium]NIY07253.1 hypothetical protein [Gemmatimonadota bacterium]
MFRHFRWILLLFLLPPPALPAQGAVPAGMATLRPGDLVRITVWRNAELSGEFEIGGDGHIQHPLYREVAVTGVPLEEAEDRVRSMIARHQSAPQFVMEPRFRVAVGGEVQEPNLYALPPERTLAQAIAMAGGPTERGRLDNVRLLRGGREFVVDMTRPDADLAQMAIRSGDQIMVARRVSVFREYIAPFAAVTAAVAAVLNVILRYQDI